MKLRIVSGRFKRRYIILPKSASDFRPTKEFVREAISSYLSGVIRNARVADLCCGSGAFGIEMISRGATKCDFIENSKARCNNLHKQLTEFGISSCEATVINSGVELFIKKSHTQYDIVFYDPPYDDEKLVLHFSELFDFVKPSGVLVYEHRFDKKTETDYKLFNIPDSFTFDKKRYGQTELLIFKNSKI